MRSYCVHKTHGKISLTAQLPYLKQKRANLDSLPSSKHQAQNTPRSESAAQCKGRMI